MNRCRAVGLAELDEGVLVVRTICTTSGCTEVGEPEELETGLADMLLLLFVGVVGAEDMMTLVSWVCLSDR